VSRFHDLDTPGFSSLYYFYFWTVSGRFINRVLPTRFSFPHRYSHLPISTKMLFIGYSPLVLAAAVAVSAQQADPAVNAALVAKLITAPTQVQRLL
jgi:hypothetical protein